MSSRAISLCRRYPAITLAVALIGLLGGLWAYGSLTAAQNDAVLARDVETRREALFPQPREVVAGDLDARVVLLEYFDLDCPYCRDYHRSGEKYLRQKYQEKDVAFARRHMPLTYLHPHALIKAQVLECAASLQPDVYEPSTTFLYETPFSGTSTLVSALARAVNVDEGRLGACVESGATLDRIASERILSGIHGISATPSFIVFKDGVERGRVVGSRTNQLDTTIELLLSEN